MKNIIFIFLLLFLNSCSSNKQESVNLPSWYLNIEEDETYIYGLGEGETLQSAKSSALNFIASSISVGVSSILKKDESYTKNDELFSSYKNVKNSINLEVNKIDFSKPKIINNVKISDKFYIKIAVNKNELFKNYKEKLDLDDEKIQNYYKMEKSPYEKIRLIKNLEKDITKAKSKVYILKALNVNFPSYKYIDRYNSYLLNKDKLISNIRISIKNDNPFASVLINQLNKKGFKISNNSYDVKITLNNNIKKSKYASFKIVKISTNIIVKNQNKIISNEKINTIGRSSIDYQNAIENASKSFLLKIKTKGIEKVIGL